MGVLHAIGWWPKSSCCPSKVCLPWVSKGGIWDVPGILPGCPGPLRAFKKFVCKKVRAHFRSLPTSLVDVSGHLLCLLLGGGEGELFYLRIPRGGGPRRARGGGREGVYQVSELVSNVETPVCTQKMFVHNCGAHSTPLPTSKVMDFLLNIKRTSNRIANTQQNRAQAVPKLRTKRIMNNGALVKNGPARKSVFWKRGLFHRGSIFGDFPEPLTGIFSKVLPVQMGGILRCK